MLLKKVPFQALVYLNNLTGEKCEMSELKLVWPVTKPLFRALKQQVHAFTFYLQCKIFLCPAFVVSCLNAKLKLSIDVLGPFIRNKISRDLRKTGLK